MGGAASHLFSHLRLKRSHKKCKNRCLKENMDKPTIGLSQRFQPAAAVTGTGTVLSSASAAAKGKGIFNNLDWKVKLAVVLLVVGLVYFTVARHMKKKGNACSKRKSDEEAKGGDEKADKKGEKS